MIAAQARVSTADKVLAIGYDAHNPAKPNVPGMISRHGIKKMRSREDAAIRDGIPLPIPWKKELRLFWRPIVKKPKANKPRADTPSARKLASVPNSDIT
jgi:hypothetical protein